MNKSTKKGDVLTNNVAGPNTQISLDVEIGNFVWVFRNNKVQQKRIESISVTIDKDGTEVRYKLDGVSKSVSSGLVSTTRADMEKILFDRFSSDESKEEEDEA